MGHPRLDSVIPFTRHARRETVHRDHVPRAGNGCARNGGIDATSVALSLPSSNARDAVGEMDPDPHPVHEANMTNDLSLSRRDFVAATTLGLVGFWHAASARAWGQSAPAGSSLLYVGTYTEAGRHDGVHLVRMDHRTGTLRSVGVADVGPNPSFLAIHPNGRVLYAVNEVTEMGGRATGAVGAFTIARDSGQLTRLGEQPSEGAAPCYVSLDRTARLALVANYVSGTIAVLPIDSDGTLSGATQMVQHSGTGPNAARQASAHAHCIIVHPSNHFVLAADLGVDRILLYQLDAQQGTLTHAEHGDAVMRPGSGPRHLAFHPTLPVLFVTGELDSTVTALHSDPDTGAMSPLETRSTLPDGWTGTNLTADIHVAPNGRTLYASNRGHNSIAVFSIADTSGALTLEQVISTAGDWPRNFAIDPTGRWLLVANQRSGSIVVFARDSESGRLTPTSQRIGLPNPVCLRFNPGASARAG